ncbi:MAG: hypothetical protein J6386_10015 [Candidatus Synoicihabitans palmerolidicus]|nr:hypothetical protein [Candidatus Synoicihabitans palmerolidicus]
MCRNQEILPVSASLFLRSLLIANPLRLWNTLYLPIPWRMIESPVSAAASPGRARFAERAVGIRGI